MTQKMLFAALATSLAALSLARPAAAPVTATLSPGDYIEIQQLVARYGYALDTGAPEGSGGDYADLFTADGEFEGPGIAAGTQGSEKLAALARIPAGSRTRRGPTYVSHFMMNHLIEPTPQGAVGVVYALIVNRGENGQPNTISMGGHYNDVYARTAKGWKFRKRTFTRGKVALTEEPPALTSTPSRPAREPRAQAGTLTPMDYVDIRRLVANYAYGLDGGGDNGYVYADNFAPGATVFGNTTGRENIANLARREPHGPAYVRHFLTNVVIEPTPDGARGRQYLSVIDVGEAGKPSSIFLIGKYEDTYVKTPQGWRFKSRNLVRAPQAPAPTSTASTTATPPAGPPAGQTPTERPFTIVRLDPALDAIIDPATKPELLGDRFGLNEGPVWVRDGASGYLLFSDMLDNVIYKWQRGQPISVFLENAGYTGRDVLNVAQQTRRGRSAVLLVGPNGLTLDPQGRLIISAMPDRNIVRLEKDGTRTVLADRFEGKRFNGPNDVVVKSDGALYFTDSVSGLRGGGNSPQRELPFNGFFLVKNGTVTLLDETLRDPQTSGTQFPNGIALSPDEKFLYVTLGRKIMRYEIRPDDTLANRMEFADVQGNDGMKTDLAGNLYSTSGAGPGEVRITAPDGKRIGVLQMPQRGGEPRQQVCATNVAFGDADGKALYVTACMDLYRIPLKVAGVRPGPQS